MEGCLRFLEGLDYERATILRVRALTRLGRLDLALRTAVDASMQDAGDLERAQLNTVYAAVAVALRRHDVEAAFEDAERYIHATGATTLHAELAAVRAVAALEAGDVASAEALAREAAAPGADDGSSVAHRAHVRAGAHLTLAAVARRSGDGAGAAAQLREARRAYDAAPEADAWLTARIDADLAALARDVPGAL